MSLPHWLAAKMCRIGKGESVRVLDFHPGAQRPLPGISERGQRDPCMLQRTEIRLTAEWKSYLLTAVRIA